MSKIALVFCLISILCTGSSLAEAPSASQIQREQDLISQDQVLRDKISEPIKYFLKEVDISGAKCLSSEEIEDLILPYQNQWVTEKDIEALKQNIEDVYRKKGKKAKVSYRVISSKLYIEVKEE